MRFAGKVLVMNKLVKIESISKAKRKDFYKVETSIGLFQISENMIVKSS